MERFYTLYWDCFVKNCKIEKRVAKIEDFEEIKKIDADKLCKFFGVLVQDLLDFKFEVKNSELAELTHRNSQFEAMIVKLEADMRAAIAKHHQLKLEIESKNNKIEELSLAIVNERNQMKEYKAKVIQREKFLEAYKRPRSPHERLSELRGNQINDHPRQPILKDTLTVNKAFTDRAKSSISNAHSIRKIVAGVSPYRERIKYPIKSYNTYQ